ncbi:hypothetical protein MD484_g7740, partial [Candolleomyces efflorescens]
MRARLNLVTTTLKYFSTHDAVSSSLSHFLDMLRLCRSDNLGLRDTIPNLYLRLHQDQKCYDFLKWYGTTGKTDNRSWSDPSLGYLDLEDQDPMESEGLEDMFCDEWSVAHTVPALLIKLRLLLDLKDFKASFELYALVEKGKLNPDIVRTIQDHIYLRSSILSTPSSASSGDDGTDRSRSRARDLLKRQGLEERIAELERQTHKLFMSMYEANQHFWEALLEWEAYMDEPVETYSHGSLEEVVVLILNNARSWDETVGALEWVEEKVDGLYFDGAEDPDEVRLLLSQLDSEMR